MLVVTPDFPPGIGGIQTLLHGVVSGWQRLDPLVVTPAVPGADEFDRDQPLAIERVRVPPRMPHVASIAALNGAAIRNAVRFRPDAVLSGHIVVGPAALSISRSLGTPIAQYVYGREATARPRLASLSLRRADAVLAISGYTTRLALECGAPQTRVHTIPPGIPAPVSGARHRGAEPTIVVVSRLSDRYKGHDVLLQALPLVHERVPAARLVVVGDGRLRHVYEELVATLGIAGSVDFVGAVDDAARDRILARAAIFAMPSRLERKQDGEGFGIVYLEASAHGLPVVAGAAGGAVEAVVHQETGLLVDPTDHRAVAGALVLLLEDRDLAERMGRAGAARATSFSREAVSRRVEDVLMELVAR